MGASAQAGSTSEGCRWADGETAENVPPVAVLERDEVREISTNVRGRPDARRNFASGIAEAYLAYRSGAPAGQATVQRHSTSVEIHVEQPGDSDAIRLDAVDVADGSTCWMARLQRSSASPRYASEESYQSMWRQRVVGE